MHLIPLTSGMTHPVLKSITRDQLWHWGQCKTFQRLPQGHLSEEPAHGEVWQISTLSYKSGAAPEVGWKPSSLWHLLGTWWAGPHLSKEATGFLCSGSSVLHKKERGEKTILWWAKDNPCWGGKEGGQPECLLFLVSTDSGLDFPSHFSYSASHSVSWMVTWNRNKKLKPGNQSNKVIIFTLLKIIQYLSWLNFGVPDLMQSL